MTSDRSTRSVAMLGVLAHLQSVVVPGVEGSAHITGRHGFVFDPTDDLGTGFILR